MASREFIIGDGTAVPTKLTVTGSTDGNVLAALDADKPFPAGPLDLGRIAVSAGADNVAFNAAGGTVTFGFSADMRTGIGLFDSAKDAIGSLQLNTGSKLDLTIPASERYAVMVWGYHFAVKVSGTHPLGVLGAATFGVDTKRSALYAVVHGFAAADSARSVLADTIGSWHLPRHVDFFGGDVNLKPQTWLIAEAEGSIAIQLAAKLGYDVSFTREAKLLGLTKNLGAKIDASLKATFGFSASGKYVVIVGREDPSSAVRLRLLKDSKKGLSFGLNLNVGIKGQVPFPARFDDLVQAVFGQHGQQVLRDLHVIETWANPNTAIGDNVAKLVNDTALALLKQATGLDLPAQFDNARKVVLDALEQWDQLPDKVAAVTWRLLGGAVGDGPIAELKALLVNLADPDPKKRASALIEALEKHVLGDAPQAQWLEAVAEKGLLALANDLARVSVVAQQTLSILNGGVVKKLQDFIGEKLNLEAIRKAVSDHDFQSLDKWLIDRLADFLNKKVLAIEELKDIQKAIFTLDHKVRDVYENGVKAATKRYNAEFAATYERTTTDTALLDVRFDLSQGDALQSFRTVLDGSLDALLTDSIAGVTIGQATLSHSVKRQTDVALHLPFGTFESSHVNEAMTQLTIEEHAGRVLVYELKGDDRITAKRYLSELSVLGKLEFAPDGTATLRDGGTIAYETLQAKSDLRLVDLEERTRPFIEKYLAGKFADGDASLTSFYVDLDATVSARLGNQSNHLGDAALSMEVSYPSRVLEGWFKPRSDARVHDDSLRLSQRLQRTIRPLLSSAYFQNVDNLAHNVVAAPLLVWASLPVSTSVTFNGSTVVELNTGKDVFWDVFTLDSRRAMAQHPQTVGALVRALAVAKKRLHEAGKSEERFFDPDNHNFVSDFIRFAAFDSQGDANFAQLLRMENAIIKGAAGALTAVAAGVAAGHQSPTLAIRKLSEFAADLTDTFSHDFSSNYATDALRTLGPLVLAEVSAELSPAFQTVSPSAMLKLYVLNKPHPFNLDDFLKGQLPSLADVAVSQTLVESAQ